MKTIALEKTDPDFRNEVASQPGAENLKQCFSCGTCTGACPVFRVESGYNPRKIIRMVLLGMREEVLKSKEIWLCARCYACTAHCPQQVSFADVMVVLREMALKEGHAPADLPEKIEAATECAGELRRDCIRLFCGERDVSREAIVQKVKERLAELS